MPGRRGRHQGGQEPAPLAVSLVTGPDLATARLRARYPGEQGA